MRCLPWALALVGLPIFLEALVTPPASPAHALDLIEETKVEKKKKKKWNWKDASEESKTEWAIVLKRYTMVDLTLFELGRYFFEASQSVGAAGGQQAVDDDPLVKARTKFARLTSNLEKAVLDQNTSDATAGDMQKNCKTNLLTVHEKRILAEEHKREQYGYFAVEASGQDVMEKAGELLAALEAKHSQKKKPSPSWSSIVAAPPTPAPTYMSMLNATTQELNATTQDAPNTTQNNTKATRQANLRGASATVGTMLQAFEEASKTFHNDLANFEAMQSKAITNLLAMTNLLALPPTDLQ